MNDKQILAQIRSDLKSMANNKRVEDLKRYFKEGIETYGVSNPETRKISRKYWPEIKSLSKGEVYELFEQLLASNFFEEALIVAELLPRQVKQFKKDDIYIFREWIDKYLNNWAKIDSFCAHAVTDHLAKFPDDITEIISWIESNNRWMKRAAAVSLVLPARRGDYLKEIFIIADALLESSDDMVQKGYGWLLKEASRKHRKEVFDYVVRNKAIMPRTALRYAIEKMPQDMRKKAMEKS